MEKCPGKVHYILQRINMWVSYFPCYMKEILTRASAKWAYILKLVFNSSICNALQQKLCFKEMCLI